MAQVVEADTGQPRPPEQRLHAEVGRAGVDRILRLHWVGEYPLTDGIRLAPPQDARHRLRQDDGTHSLSRFGLADGVLTLPLAVEGAAHLQRAALLVEVAPLQPADLAAAQAGHQLHLKEVPPHLVPLHHRAEGIQLLAGQNALGLVVGFGRRCTFGGISGNDMGLHRVFQRSVEGGMDVAPHGVREMMPHLGMLMDAPLRFQPAVHSLDVLLRDKRDLFIAQLWFDVVFDIAAIAFERTGPHRARFVLCEPAIQPLAQRHAAVLGQLHITVALDVLMEFVQQRLLRLSVDMTEQWLAVFPVLNDDAAFPSPIGNYFSCPTTHRTEQAVLNERKIKKPPEIIRR